MAGSGSGPKSVEGWMRVWEVNPVQQLYLFDEGGKPEPQWIAQYCVLRMDEQIMRHYAVEGEATPSSPRSLTRILCAKKDFDQHYGCQVTDTPISHESRHKFVFGRTRDSSYDRAVDEERRGSVPALTLTRPSFSLTPTDDQDAGSTISSDSKSSTKKSSGVRTQFIRRTRSNAKLEKRKNATSPSLTKTAGSQSDVSWSAASTLPACPSATNTSTPLTAAPNGSLLGRLKRSLSLTRLNKKRSRSRISEDMQANLSSSEKVKAARSYESLLASGVRIPSVDLGDGNAQVQPLHRSMLGEDNCIQVTSCSGSTFYCTRNSEEKSQWVSNLRKTVNPGEEQTRRSDVSLKLWIQEAKNCAPKKRYFCEISLDKTLYARTSVKCKGDMLFWGEQFDFDNLPAIKILSIALFKEADKKKKREKNAQIGYINIPVSELDNSQIIEKWHTLSSAVVGKIGKENKSELPLIRIKVRYQTVEILPLSSYTKLLKFIKENYQPLVENLEPLLAVRTKDDFASSLVHILQREQLARRFLCDIVMSEMHKHENLNLMLRGNTIATKAIEAYMKLVGNKYLHETLEEFVRMILDESLDCEVDSSKITNNANLQNNQRNLISYCELVWGRVVNSFSQFPSELRDVFASFRRQCEHLKRSEVADNLISACIFLRFLCPAIMSPSLFGLCQELPEEKQSRSLTLVAKTLQSLANFTKFGAKEDYMLFMNAFVEREWNQMQNYLKQISSSDHSVPLSQFDGYIDSGKHLSLLHAQLTENLPKPESEQRLKFKDLDPLLQDLTLQVNSPFSNSVVPLQEKATLVKPAKPLRPESDEYVELSHDRCKEYQVANDIQVDTTPSTAKGQPPRQLNLRCTTEKLDLEVSERIADASGLELRQPLAGPADIRQAVTLARLPTRDAEKCDIESAVRNADSDTLKSNSSTGSRKIVRHRVWDRVLTANEFVNEDEDRSSQLSDSIAAPSSGYHSSTSRTSPIEAEVKVEETSKPTSFPLKGPASITSASSKPQSLPKDPLPKEPALAFINPAFKHATDCIGSPRRGSGVSTNHISEFTPLPNKFNSLNLTGKSKQTTDKPDVAAKNIKVVHSEPEIIKALPPHTGVQELPAEFTDGDPSAAYRDEKRYGCARFPVELYGPRAQPEGSTCPDVAPLTRAGEPMDEERPSTPNSLLSWRGSQMSLNSQQSGIRNVQKRIDETEKIKLEYEAEVAVLREQLTEAQQRLAGTEGRLSFQAQQTNLVMGEWKARLDESEERLRAQQHEKDEQIKSIIQRLLAIEEDLRQEQTEMKSAIAKKEQIIDSQERRIRELDAANSKLQKTLNELKERSQAKKDKTYKTTLYVNDYKSSFC